MREIPILFSEPMVKAILAGKKTQTRRTLYVVRKMRAKSCFHTHYPPPVLDLEAPRHGPGECFELSNWARAKVGDRLWVREAWSTHACFNDVPPAQLTTRSIHYAADGKILTGKGRPSIHMPRWASRITLEITGVRIQRLKAITKEDAIAEGVEDTGGRMFGEAREDHIERPISRSKLWTPLETHQFSLLWDSINYERSSWNDNDWVVALTFKRIDQ